MESFSTQLIQSHELVLAQRQEVAGQMAEADRATSEQQRSQEELVGRINNVRDQILGLVKSRQHTDPVLRDPERADGSPEQRAAVVARHGENVRLFDDEFDISAHPVSRERYITDLRLEGEVVYKRDLLTGVSQTEVRYPVGVSLSLREYNEGSSTVVGDKSTVHIAYIDLDDAGVEDVEDCSWVYLDPSWELNSGEQVDLQKEVVEWIDYAYSPRMTPWLL